MDDLDRLADDRNEVEPAARRDSALAELQYSIRERVAVAEVGEEPAVEVRLAQSRLNLGDAGGLLLPGLRLLRAGGSAEEGCERGEREGQACGGGSFHVVRSPHSGARASSFVELAKRRAPAGVRDEVC